MVGFLGRRFRPISFGVLGLPWLAACATPPGNGAPARDPPRAADVSVARDAGATPVAVTSCQRMVASARLRQHPAPPPLTCVAGSLALQRELAPALAAPARHPEGSRLVHVDFPCTAVRLQPAQARALVVYGHGGATYLAGASPIGADTVRVRLLRAATGGGPTDIPVRSPEFIRRDLPAATFAATFDHMRTALAARVTIRVRPEATSASYTSSSQDVALEVALRDTLGGASTRAWAGYVGSFRAEERVPVELAARALLESVDADHAPVSREPEPEDRELLSEAWRTRSDGYERPWDATGALLLLATRAGSPDILPFILDALQSDDGRHRRFIIDALAAITGYDVRRDANGVERDLAEVAAEYRRECGGI